MIEQHLVYRVDLDKPISTTFMNTLFATKNAAAHRIDVQLYRGNTPVNLPDGTAVYGNMLRRADPEKKTVFITGSADGNTVSITLSRTAYAMSGAFSLNIDVTIGDATGTVFHGEGSMITGSTETTEDDDKIIYNVSQLLSQINAMQAATTEANTAAENAQNVADEVQRKLDNGEFVGATGPEGPQGPAGEGSAPNDAEPTTTNPYSGAKTQALHDELVIKKADAIMPTESGTLVHMEDSGEHPIQGLTVYGRSWQDGEPTLDSPAEIRSVGDGGVTVKAYGKNLIPFPYATKSTPTVLDGVTYTINNDGSVHLSGTLTKAYSGIILAKQDDMPRAGRYRVYGKTTNGAYVQVFIRRNGALSYPMKGAEFTIYGDEEDLYVSISAGATIGKTFDETIFPIVVADTSTDVSYAPFVGNTATLADVEPLRGIRVSSGGNVTVDGQQYIADTLTVRSDGTGEIERRAFSELLDASVNHSYSQTDSYVYYSLSNETLKDGICSHLSQISFNSIGSSLKVFGFSSKEEFTTFISENDVHIVYSLKTPIIELLTAEQVQALLTLHTYKPITNMYTGDGAYMDATYIADTKAYVDTKPGTPGPQGEAGAAGYTPQKGTDYWTEEDKAAMVADVLAALPNASGVSF